MEFRLQAAIRNPPYQTQEQRVPVYNPSKLLLPNAYIMTRELAGNFARLPIRISCRHSNSIISIHLDPERSHRIERSVVHFYGPHNSVGPERRTAMVVD